MDICLQELYGGSAVIVCALEMNGECPSLEFFEEIRNHLDFNKLKGTLSAFSKTPNFRNEKVFRSARDKIWEFATRGGIRLYGFNDRHQNQRVMITLNGGLKGNRKQQTKEIKIAIAWRDRFMAAKSTTPVSLRRRENTETTPLP